MKQTIENIAPAAGAGPAAERRPWLWWGLAALWMGIIFYFSAQSSFDFVPERWQVDPVSWAVHFGEYAVLALLLWQALRATARLSRRAASLAFLLTALYAISDEWHQFYVPGRYSDVRDVLVDALGALTALLLAQWLQRRRNR
jgi:VanZ family protein